ncbi:hypothetical protein Tcan_12299 [Toxocara canis]|uniref:Uncharacterized protein n=1 Tax=Toxocara canis TaxID=6265 RepID=A0A0B2VGP2_TOXCA|nr:hypothetical protein Tcan_12299 [Toxocara canis]
MLRRATTKTGTITPMSALAIALRLMKEMNEYVGGGSPGNPSLLSVITEPEHASDGGDELDEPAADKDEAGRSC